LTVAVANHRAVLQQYEIIRPSRFPFHYSHGCLTLNIIGIWWATVVVLGLCEDRDLLNGQVSTNPPSC